MDEGRLNDSRPVSPASLCIPLVTELLRARCVTAAV
jgi:hypothetical protein